MPPLEETCILDILLHFLHLNLGWLIFLEKDVECKDTPLLAHQVMLNGQH